MRLKIIIIFFLTILIPTSFLAYFGLLAVRSEKAIVEKNMKERYEFMLDIVMGEIKDSLATMPKELLNDPKYLESVIVGEASIFKDQIRCFDKYGRQIGGPIKSFTHNEKKGQLDQPVLTRQVAGLPYTIALYERYPLFVSKKLEEKRKGLYFYVLAIAFSTLAILGGGFFTLWRLSREWHLAELKSEFVSVLAHDLRRPLTSIRMFSEMLKDNRVSTEEKKKEYYAIINSQTERLTHLANNVLDFSRIERGRKKYDFKYENIANIVRDTVAYFKRHMLDEERPVMLSIEENIPPLKIDGNSISQALMNLLCNASKFSPQDKEIKVNLLCEKRRHKEVVIEVIDHGIGIPQREQKRIFQKFYRSSQEEVKEREGSGLGLTLVRYIARAHGGRVEVESEEGKGSRFSLVLPA